MKECEVCGNAYDKALAITVAGGSEQYFDSLECAIHALAPACAHCGCRIIGHGIEDSGTIFCCAHCAKEEGATGARDRLD
jgi:nitrite reductase/ring-hydroxylating ferredoxin subunit